MKKTALFMLLVSFVLVSCNANGQGEQVNKKETIKESNTNLKTKSKMKTIHLTKEEFLTKVANFETSPNEWKYLGDKPAIIDFYAEWCGPCKMQAPILQDLKKNIGDAASIVKIDIDKNQAVAAQFGIRSVPTLMIFKNGEVKWKQSGVFQADELERLIKQNL